MVTNSFFKMMASTSSIELTFLLGSNPLLVDRKLRAQFFTSVGKTKKKAREIRTVNKNKPPHPEGLFFSSTFERGGGGLNKEAGLLNVAKSINGSKVSRGRTCGSRALYCFF